MTLYGNFSIDRKTLVFQGLARCNRGVTWLFYFFVRLHLSYIVFGQALNVNITKRVLFRKYPFCCVLTLSDSYF